MSSASSRKGMSYVPAFVNLCLLNLGNGQNRYFQMGLRMMSICDDENKRFARAAFQIP